MSRYVGIDLGTSTSEIACVVDGAPVVIPNHLGKLITPSVVHIQEDGTPLIGEAAQEYLFTRPDCTFMEVKRKTASGETLAAHGKPYSPEEIQAMILRYLLDCARAHLGEEIEHAVVTVPAYFTDAQRRATARAGELAGVTVDRILNEPTAAALDYGLQNLDACRNLLVYDFGGGTLDVTVLELFEGVIDVRASSGNNHLGGREFDLAIMAHLQAEILEKHRRDPARDPRAMMRLKSAAESCKIALSEAESYDVEIPFFMTGPHNAPLSLTRSVTRAEFEEWIAPQLDDAWEPVTSALRDAKLEADDIDMVLLVGGSTRVPAVRDRLARHLNIPMEAIVDPDLAVARGAAIQAAILEGVLTGESEIVLTDVCPFTLSTAVLHDGAFDQRMICDVLIPRNTAIPTSKTQIYYPVRDYQTVVEITAYQGEAVDPEHNELLGAIRISDMPPERSANQPVAITFSYDMNGILQVEGKLLRSGRAVRTEISTQGTEPKKLIDVSKWLEAEGAKRYRPAVNKAERLIRGGSALAEDLGLIVQRLKEAIVLESPQEEIEEIYQELRDALEDAR